MPILNFLVGSGSTSSYIDAQILQDIGSLLTAIMGWITANTYLVVFFTIGLVFAGIGLFKGLKRSVR